MAALASRARLGHRAPGAARLAAPARGLGAARSRRAPVVRAMIREWPDPEFIQHTLAAFPDDGVADAEQARCLYSNGGYTYLDVRSALEVEDVGKVKDSVNIPFVNARKVYDAETRTKKVVKEDNPDFIRMVEKRFPSKDAKLLIGCGNGTQYSISALEALDEAGYTNIVGLRGGYRAWFSVWDNKLGRRRSGEYSEQYTHDGDSAGIHSSGAGFEKMDPKEAWVPPMY
ncbi:STR16 [Scenedesmus sp. PABB004]|nr:STR16 [Scenedesmus sp. PABB004]